MGIAEGAISCFFLGDLELGWFGATCGFEEAFACELPLGPTFRNPPGSSLGRPPGSLFECL